MIENYTPPKLDLPYLFTLYFFVFVVVNLFTLYFFVFVVVNLFSWYFFVFVVVNLVITMAMRFFTDGDGKAADLPDQEKQDIDDFWTNVSASVQPKKVVPPSQKLVDAKSSLLIDPPPLPPRLKLVPVDPRVPDPSYVKVDRGAKPKVGNPLAHSTHMDPLHTPGFSPSCTPSFTPSLAHYHVSPLNTKISQFSGDDQKGDVSYVEWRYEVKCLVQDPDFPQTSLAQTIRRSLRGTARRILVALSEQASASDMLGKLDSLFSDVSTNEMVMQDFYNSEQNPDESVTSFGCRLENLLQVAIDHGFLPISQKNELLRHKFWTSLSSERLKSQTRHKYDSIRNYDILLREIRTVEKELSMTHSTSSLSKKVVHHPVVVGDELGNIEKRFDSKLANLEKRLDSKLDEKFNRILSKLDQQSQPQASVPHNNNNNNNNNKGGNQQYYHKNKGGGGNYRGKGGHNPQQNSHQTPNQESLNSQEPL